MRSFQDLKAWQLAHRFTLAVYAATRSFPREELFGLTSQLRRAASSIGTNLAVVCGRGSDADFARFCHIALGSASESEYLLILARDLGYVKNSDWTALHALVEETKRTMIGLLRRLRPDNGRLTADG
jgi:four helix bundle protein